MKIIVILAERRDQAADFAAQQGLRPEQWYYPISADRLIGYRHARVVVLETAPRHPEFGRMMEHLGEGQAEFVHIRGGRQLTVTEVEERAAALKRIYQQSFGKGYRLRRPSA